MREALPAAGGHSCGLSPVRRALGDRALGAVSPPRPPWPGARRPAGVHTHFHAPGDGKGAGDGGSHPASARGGSWSWRLGAPRPTARTTALPAHVLIENTGRPRPRQADGLSLPLRGCYRIIAVVQARIHLNVLKYSGSPSPGGRRFWVFVRGESLSAGGAAARSHTHDGLDGP